jgi:hypothetical protein
MFDKVKIIKLIFGGNCMKKQIYIILFFLFLSSIVYSNPIIFSDMGYLDFSVESSDKNKCTTFVFELDQQQLDSSKFPILSLKTKFLPVLDESTRLNLKFNDFGNLILFNTDFSCQTDCWARVIIPKNILNLQNKLELCAVTSKNTEKIIVFAESNINFYETPIFSIEKISPGTIFLGERAQMNIVAKNHGSKDANVFIQFIDPIGKKVVKIDSFDIVEGESTVNTLLRVGETKKFTYYIKPTIESSYNLPSAVLIYQDIFGETQKIYSPHPVLYVIKPKQIETFIVGSNPEKNIFNFKIIVKNKWDVPFNGQVRVSHEDHVEGAFFEIKIPPNTQREFLFKTNKLAMGDYNFFAIIEDENSSVFSNNITFSIKLDDFSEDLYFAIAGGVVSIIIFLGIYMFWKESKI